MVTAPLAANQDRNAFKSPGNRQQNKNLSEDEKSAKRILSFGGKKLIAGRFLDESDACNKKSVDAGVGNYSGSPQVYKGVAKFPGLDVSEQKGRKEAKLNTSNEERTKAGGNIAKNVPKFIVNSNIKSSPYLPKKLALDSSN